MKLSQVALTRRALFSICLTIIFSVIATSYFSRAGASESFLFRNASRASAASPTAQAPLPVIDLKVPGMEFPESALVGEEFCYTARIENYGDVPGFGPAIVLALPEGLSLSGVSLPGVSGSAMGTPASNFPISAQGPFTTDPLNQQPPLTGQYSYYVIPAPIGSLFPGMPGIDLKICVKVDVNIKPDVPVSVCHTPYFQFGASATGSGQTIGERVCSDLTPVLVKLSKKILAPTSNKLPPLPTNEVVTGCSAYTFQLCADIAKDVFLLDLNFTDILPDELVFVPGSVVVKGVSGPPLLINDNTNPGGGGALTVLVNDDTGVSGPDPDVIVEFKAYVKNFLDKDSCETKVISNTAKLDAINVDGEPVKQQTATLPIEVEHVAIQKTAAGPRADPFIVVPGDTVSYRLDFQVSQDISANIVIEDMLPNGMQFNSGSAMISCASGFSGPITTGATVNQQDGTTRLVFDLGPNPLPGCTSCSIFYTAQVSQSYTHSLAGNPVRASDLLVNEAKVKYSIVGGMSACEEDTVGAVLVSPVAISKTIKNPKAEYMPGDLVRFSLKMIIPSGDTKDITFIDYLPLPIFNVTGNQPFNIQFGTNHNAGGTFTVDRNPAQNAVTFTFNDVVTSGNPVPCIEIEFSVLVTTDPFADGLFLTNLFQSFTTNTAGQVQTQLTGVVLHVRAPRLKIIKGVFSVDNTDGVIAPAPSITPVNGDVSGVDANDIIIFYLTVTNEGGAPAYSPTITDVLPSSLTALSVQSQAPAPAVNVTPSLTTNPKTITIQFPPASALPPGGTWIVEMKARVESGIAACKKIDNKASVKWRNIFDPDVISPGVPLPPFYPDSAPDTASVTTAAPKVTKTIVTTNQPHTSGNDAAIGEVVTYKVDITFPEGTSNGVMVMDNLPPGLAIQSVVPSGVQPTITATGSPAISLSGGSLTSAVLVSPGNKLSFNFGDVANSDSNNGVDETISFTYGVVVLNTSGNLNGATLTNNVTVSTTDCLRVAVSAPPLKIVEPKLKVAKEALNAQGQPISAADAGDLITFVITVAHDSASTADAFDVVLSDLIPPGHVYQPGSLMVMGGNQPPDALNAPTPPANSQWSAQWNHFPLGKTSVIKFTTTIANNAAPCRSLNNTAEVKWTSLPALPRFHPISQLNSNSCERGYELCGELNNYVAGATAALAVPKPSITKTLKSTSANHTPGNSVTIGEVLTYEIRVCLPEGTTPASVLTDQLPAGLSAVSAQITQTNGITGLPASLQITPGNGAAQTFNFGALTVPGDNNPNNNCFVIELRAIVLNVPSNNGMPGMQTTLDNVASFSVRGCNIDPSRARAIVVEPKLTIKKEFAPSTVEVGKPVEIKLTVTNTGTSDAFDVIIQDALNSAFAGIQAVTTPQGFSFNLNGQTVSYATGAGVSIKPGETVTLVFKAIPSICGEVLNTATINQYSTLSGAVAGERVEPVVSGSAALTVVGPIVDLKSKGLYNTGVNNSHQKLPVNQLDSHYPVTDSADQVSLPAVINPGTGWATLPNAGWISPRPWSIDTYRFKIKFNLAGCDAASAQIGGRYTAGGKSAYILINNDPTPQFPHNDPTTFRSFFISGLNQGENTITFVVESGDFRPALLVEFLRATARCCGCPERFTITPNALPVGDQFVSYPATAITASGGSGPHTYSITGGKLPAGMALSPSGVLSGAPTEAGHFSITVTATDKLGCSKPRQYQLNIRKQKIGPPHDAPPKGGANGIAN